MSLLVLSAADVERIVSAFAPSQLQSLMARVFVLLSSQSTEVNTPHRILISTSNHTALFMPSRIGCPSLLGTTVKVVSVPRSNEDARGLPASTLVLDEDTGAVKAIVNARSLTALRNAAGSLLSSNLVGLRTPKNIVAFGAGKQVEAHLDMHIRFFPSIKTCTIVNRSVNERAQSLKASLELRFSEISFFLLSSEISSSETTESPIKVALSAADLVVCATSATSPLFPSSWIRSGTHIILIGSYTPSMREADAELIRRSIPTSTDQLRRSYRAGDRVAQVLLVDSREACAGEAGELIDSDVKGDEVIEIGELVPHDSSGEPELGGLQHITTVCHTDDSGASQNDFVGPVTIFKSVGVGLQDVAIACAVVEMAEKEASIGTHILNYDTKSL
ncbi:hypothetical protein BDQ12DRAFT_631010 [Crucibulum laeve]|uniref:NAD(P)-binding protein n=1 Tax=Crucibulum laeve TaxID=68775 RepID=A0A5C3M296_9AGAR|nr:hypothetical protein BDQ12DRAFT_631010 [Crucibulum laeve]